MDECKPLPAGKFFTGYRRCDMKEDEILRCVTLPLTVPGEYVREFKQSHRREAGAYTRPLLSLT